MSSVGTNIDNDVWRKGGQMQVTCSFGTINARHRWRSQRSRSPRNAGSCGRCRVPAKTKTTRWIEARGMRDPNARAHKQTFDSPTSQYDETPRTQQSTALNDARDHCADTHRLIRLKSSRQTPAHRTRRDDQVALDLPHTTTIHTVPLSRNLETGLATIQIA
jgi:hypothetical protein